MWTLDTCQKWPDPWLECHVPPCLSSTLFSFIHMKAVLFIGCFFYRFSKYILGIYYNVNRCQVYAISLLFTCFRPSLVPSPTSLQSSSST